MRISVASKAYAIAGAALCTVILIGAWLQRKQIPAFFDFIDDDTRLFLTQTLFYVGGQPVRVLFVIKVFLFLGFLHLLSLAARRSIKQLVRQNPHFDQHRAHLLSQAVAFSIYLFGLLIGIHVERINLSTLVVLGGALGVGVGFGLQSLVSNFVAGIILLVEQPIRLGDRIEFGDKTGEVIRVGSRSSWIKTFDNAILVVPNSEFVSKQILNWTAHDPKVRVAISIPVAYSSDAERVMQTLLEVARGHRDVLENPAPQVILSELGLHATSFTLRVWTLTRADDIAQLRSDIYLQVIRRFREEKIEVPFPQLDLHLKSID